MLRLAIIYFSGTGAAHGLALALQAGAEGTGLAEVRTHRILGMEIEQGRFSNPDALTLVDESHAVIFGSPTYMGGPAAQFKAFADASSDCWEAQRWAGKLAAGFTVGACPNGDQLATLTYFSILAAQHGMLWVGLDIPGGCDPHGRNRLGSQLGLCAQSDTSEPEETDRLTAEYLGGRVARLCHRHWSAGAGA